MTITPEQIERLRHQLAQEEAQLAQEQAAGIEQDSAPAPAAPTAWELKYAQMQRERQQEQEAMNRPPAQPTYKRPGEYKASQKTDWSRPINELFPKLRH